MTCQHQWKRVPNPPRDRVQCELCGTHARAVHPFRTQVGAWTFEIEKP